MQTREPVETAWGFLAEATGPVLWGQVLPCVWACGGLGLRVSVCQRTFSAVSAQGRPEGWLAGSSHRLTAHSQLFPASPGTAASLWRPPPSVPWALHQPESGTRPPAPALPALHILAVSTTVSGRQLDRVPGSRAEHPCPGPAYLLATSVPSSTFPQQASSVPARLALRGCHLPVIRV